MSHQYKMHLRVILGAFFLLSTRVIHADALWQGVGSTTTTTELSTATNWSAGTLPTGSTLADFGVSSGPGYTLTATTGGLSALGFVFEPSDPTSYTLTANGQAISIGTSGVVNNAAVTQTLQTTNGGTMTIAAVSGGVNSAGQNVNYNVGVAGSGSSLTFAGATNGNGIVTVYPGNTFTVGGNSTIGQLYSANSNITMTNTVLNGSLTITSMSTFPTIGAMSGPGAFIASATTASPYDYMYLGGPNTYTGGTVINGGIVDVLNPLPVNGVLTINGGSLALDSDQMLGTFSGAGGSINWNASTHSVTVNQSSNATYAGTFISSLSGASFTLTGPATLQLTGNSSAFVGSVTVNSGNLQVNGSLGATSILVNSGGTLSGTGTFGTPGNLTTIASGGTLTPGNSVGVVTNAGNQAFNAGSFFTLFEDGLTSTPTPPGSNSLLIVNATTTVGTGGAATVNLIPVNNLINLNTKQAFIESAGGLTVTTPFAINYSSALTAAGFNLALIDAPALSFDANNYYVLTQTNFANAITASSGNTSAAAIAEVFDSISNPNTAENLFLNELAKLPTADLVNVLDDASGSQYATSIFSAELSNRRFIRRLYDPLRYLVTTEPCCCCVCDPCCQNSGLDVWASAGGGQTQIDGNHGVRFNEWDVTVGLQQTFNQDFTVGIAGSYERNNMNYHGGNGRGNGHSWFGGLYGLYRPACWYALADVAYGYTKHKVHRHLVIGTVEDCFKAKPQISQVTFYAEAGFDWNLCSFLIQPFVGLEVAGHCRKGFAETDLDLSGLSLIVNKQDRTAAVSSLGVHLTDQFCSDFRISVDLAWLYRFTNNGRFNASFASLVPGTTFPVFGPTIGRNSGEGAITVSKDFNNVRVFLEASGEVWSKASSYNVLGGLQVTW